MKEIALYIHIPFCKKKCLYCDFNSYIIHKGDVEEYIEALCEEIISYVSSGLYKFKTVFIGGGTPTVIKWENIYKIMELIKPYVDSDAEITIECNPDTMDKESIKKYFEMGINRLSIGLQAKQKKLLKNIGRIHSYEDFLRGFYLARNQGYKNINIDVIFSLPAQTINMWGDTLENICMLNPEHISCYSLILEKGTPLYSLIETGKISLVDEDTDREMYYLAKSILKDNGYEQYEISNFAKPGYQCKHNLIYWENDEYLGVGCGSHSKLNQRRFWNVKDVQTYINKVENKKSLVEDYEDIDAREDMWETIILGLRLNKGINIAEFNNKYKIDFMNQYGNVVKELGKKDLLRNNGTNIYLTEKGMDLSNTVFIKFSDI